MMNNKRSSRATSRFCAGERFYVHHHDPGKRPRVELRYGGAIEYLQAQGDVMSDVGRDVDMKQWVLHQKIYIVGVLVDEIERRSPWPTESRESLKWFKQNTGKTQVWTCGLKSLQTCSDSRESRYKS